MNEENQPRFGFVNFAETWNGRMAMMGILIGLGTELITGQSILRQIGIGWQLQNEVVNHLISSAFISTVLSLASTNISELFFLRSAPQFKHLSVEPNDIEPHASQVLNLDLKELKLIKANRINKTGIKIIVIK